MNVWTCRGGRLAVVIAWYAIGCATAEELIPLSEVRSLSEEVASLGNQVRVRGVVTFSNEAAVTLFIHDGRSGLFIKQNLESPSVWPEVGDRVEVLGVTSYGVFAPVISGKDGASPTITILGKGKLPEPRPVTGAELARPDVDCDWVVVEADVLKVMSLEDDLIFECRAGLCDFHALIEGPLPPESVPWNLADSRVRIRGVVATVFNTSGQMTRRFMRLNSPADVEVLPGFEKSRGSNLVETGRLLRVDGPGPEDTVRIRGVVTFYLPGKGMFLRADDGGLWVQTAQILELAPGVMVEANGRPGAGAMKPFIRANGVEILGKVNAPLPVSHRAAELLDARFESELVSVEAELLNVYQGADGTTLELQDGPVIFRSWQELTGKRPGPLRLGSKLRVCGIAQITSAGAFAPLQEEDKLLIRLRSSEDVVLLARPPWWTARRLAWLFAGILGLIAALFLRARTKRRRALESEHRAIDAVLAERGRFAREIHDSLAQGLTSVSLQLECVRHELAEAPEKASNHLEIARELVRESMREARRTIWNLRPLALGESDLATALQKYALELTGDSEISCQQQIEGSPHPLKHEHEHALLRIGQESLTNAVRHANPHRIDVRLRYGDGWVTLVVKDDGSGFDVADRVGKGYGLTGMHERVDALGGSLSIDSHPDEGTEVSVTLPV